MLVVGPEHARVFADAGWTKSQLKARVLELLTLPGAEMVRGAGGMAEGMPEFLASADVPKFRGRTGCWSCTRAARRACSR